jgi:hypothetical protein
MRQLKKKLELGQHLGIIAQLKTPGDQNPAHYPSPSTCLSANSKRKTILHGLSIPNPNSSKITFFGN